MGQLTWKPDSTGLVGVAWYNHPFPMACPDCTNRNSKIFTTNLVDTSDRKFLLLTGDNLHVYAPRLTPDGQTLVYFENDLRTHGEDLSGLYIMPGTQRVSRRLMKMNFARAVTIARQAGNLAGEFDLTTVVVKQVKYPFEQHDGTIFSGLYPKFPLPLRVFSHDGDLFYLTVFARDALRLIAVNIHTTQVWQQVFAQVF